MMINNIFNEDCRETLKRIPDNFIDCVVTSPPYWGLRDYGANGQLGLEKTPEEYVEKMVAIFREIKRALKPEGTVWLNLGDSYAGGGCGGHVDNKANKHIKSPKHNNPANNLKPKDLIGIPWRVAFALQADGWYLRSDIIWHKPNPMPESVTDRPTKSHEYIFLLTKSAKYYYDAEAIKEDSIDPESFIGRRPRNAPNIYYADQKNCKNAGSVTDGKLTSGQVYEKRNKRSVWTVTTKPFKEAHFAVYPPDLIRPCILAGCPVDGIVYDPFMGSGTTAEVAILNRRNYIGSELNADYIKLFEKRLALFA
jgi:DNA modification methylase